MAAGKHYDPFIILVDKPPSPTQIYPQVYFTNPIGGSQLYQADTIKPDHHNLVHFLLAPLSGAETHLLIEQSTGSYCGS